MSKRSIFEEVGETAKAPAPTPGKAEADRTGARAAIRAREEFNWSRHALAASRLYAEALAAGASDADDVRPHVGQQHGSEWAGPDAPQLQNCDSVKWSHGPRLVSWCARLAT